ncbi:MAG: AtpZ/AtpI family protein [Candidatus Hydrogenedentes bacterium]|nr:AtpZ/AtpI family protein [Candidatus Hydrogenedentota bacterium]
MKSPKDEQLSAIAGALTLVSQLGLVVVLPMVLLTLTGHYVDTRTGWHGAATVVGLLLGLAAGLYGAYRLLSKETKWKP